MFKRGLTVGLVTSCIVMQEEKVQTPAGRNEVTQSVTGTSNDTDTHIGGASSDDAKKSGRKADSTVYRKQTILQNRKRKASIH